MICCICGLIQEVYRSDALLLEQMNNSLMLRLWWLSARENATNTRERRNPALSTTCCLILWVHEVDNKQQQTHNLHKRENLLKICKNKLVSHQAIVKMKLTCLMSAKKLLLQEAIKRLPSRRVTIQNEIWALVSGIQGIFRLLLVVLMWLGTQLTQVMRNPHKRFQQWRAYVRVHYTINLWLHSR